MPWCHDAIRTRKTANCQPTASRSYYFWRKSTEFSSNTSDWKFYRRTLFYLWQHLVLLQQRPVIGDQQAQRNDSVRRYYLPDDSRHFRSPRGFLATRLFSSIPVLGKRETLSSVQQIETFLRILDPFLAHSFIKSSRHGSNICVPSFVLSPVSLRVNWM